MKLSFSSISKKFALVLILFCLAECRTSDREVEPEEEDCRLTSTMEYGIVSHQYTYDESGRLTYYRGGLKYDQDGFLTQFGIGSSRPTLCFYKNGKLSKVTNESQTFDLEYTASGQLLRIIHDDSFSALYSITEFINDKAVSQIFKSKKNPDLVNGNVWEFEEGRVVKMSYSEAVTEISVHYEREYDAEGRLIRESSFNKNKLQNEYITKYRNGKDPYTGFPPFKGVPEVLDILNMYLRINGNPGLVDVYEIYTVRGNGERTKIKEFNNKYELNARDYPTSMRITGKYLENGIWKMIDEQDYSYTYQNCE